MFFKIRTFVKFWSYTRFSEKIKMCLFFKLPYKMLFEMANKLAICIMRLHLNYLILNSEMFLNLKF